LFRNSVPGSSKPLLNLAGVRLERVASIRAAIANGSYGISSADLAQKLIDQMMGHFR
jgi:anti-sigma28 factor (negative regulator of flagellin synthesis)